jgi:hypothetical protein
MCEREGRKWVRNILWKNKNNSGRVSINRLGGTESEREWVRESEWERMSEWERVSEKEWVRESEWERVSEKE